jgi:hypothetical protein
MDKIVRAPEDALTVHTEGVVEAKTVTPVFEGVVAAVTVCVPAASPNTTPTGLLPKLNASGATKFTVAEFKE